MSTQELTVVGYSMIVPQLHEKMLYHFCIVLLLGIMMIPVGNSIAQEVPEKENCDKLNNPQTYEEVIALRYCIKHLKDPRSPRNRAKLAKKQYEGSLRVNEALKNQRECVPTPQVPCGPKKKIKPKRPRDFSYEASVKMVEDVKKTLPCMPTPEVPCPEVPPQPPAQTISEGNMKTDNKQKKKAE
ncbi:MAG: hypothetical protein HQM12_13825 [SAR324 cluster bacterium]|nr:hypothetical protein [SAR324 cluster bacterium]